MIGVAICGGLFCAFAAGCCFGYAIHKQRLDKELRESLSAAYMPKPKRNANGRFTK